MCSLVYPGVLYACLPFHGKWVSQPYILKARVVEVQTPQTLCNFPQKDHWQFVAPHISASSWCKETFSCTLLTCIYLAYIFYNLVGRILVEPGYTGEHKCKFWHTCNLILVAEVCRVNMPAGSNLTWGAIHLLEVQLVSPAHTCCLQISAGLCPRRALCGQEGAEFVKILLVLYLERVL